MTDAEYLERSKKIQELLGTIRGQIDAHVAVRGTDVGGRAIDGLLKRQQEIIGKLGELEREFWG